MSSSRLLAMVACAVGLGPVAVHSRGACSKTVTISQKKLISHTGRAGILRGLRIFLNKKIYRSKNRSIYYPKERRDETGSSRHYTLRGYVSRVTLGRLGESAYQAFPVL